MAVQSARLNTQWPVRSHPQHRDRHHPGNSVSALPLYDGGIQSHMLRLQLLAKFVHHRLDASIGSIGGFYTINGDKVRIVW